MRDRIPEKRDRTPEKRDRTPVSVPEILAAEIPEILAGHQRMSAGWPRRSKVAKEDDREISSGSGRELRGGGVRAQF
jgi:hypothetical protein